MNRFSWYVELGRRAFRRGDPMPPRPADDEDASLKAARWYGYMLERAKKLTANWRTRRIIETGYSE